MKRRTTQFALCLDNTANEASLILGKVYRVLPDPRAAKDDLIRIIDESGEDYLFAGAQFVVVDFPQPVRRKLLALQKAG
jgi:hypothetical protein